MTDGRGDRVTEQPITVVHVDDDPDFADLVRRYLEREGGGDEGERAFEVVSTTDPAEAVDRLDDRDVDCVVSGLDLPGTDGLALARSVRETQPDLPFVLFTGTATEDLTRRALAAGVTEVVRRDGGVDRLDVLAHRIRTSVNRYRMGRTVASGDRGTGPTVHDGVLVQATPRREPASETADGGTGGVTAPPSAKTIETQRDRSDRREGGDTDPDVDSDAIRTRIDDAWSARKTEDASPAADPDTRFRADENGLRRLLGNLELFTADRSVETASGRLATLPDGFYLEKRRGHGPDAGRREAVDSAGTDGPESTDIGVDGIRQIALEYGWQARVGTGPDDRPRIELEWANRPTALPR